MGCDIHLFCEIKKDGEWKYSGKIFKNPYFEPDKPNEVEEDGFEWNAEYTDEPYHGRNYDLFGILADVRNGVGFAGCDRGDGFNPIDEPRGLPDDVSPEIEKKSDDWGGDGHSHSYFTVKELLDYDWTQTTKHRGFVSSAEAAKFRRTGEKPDSWCGWTNQKNYEQIEWEEPYSESAGHFLTDIIPELQKLGSDEDVRMVFWFDN